MSISSGNSHSCALLTDGKVMCWGLNDHQQLGGNSGIITHQPWHEDAYRSVVEVPGITTATAIALGRDHSCALLAEGKVKCWGSNQNSQLGETQPNDVLLGNSIVFSTVAIVPLRSQV